jgi:hypothetical protein
MSKVTSSEQTPIDIARKAAEGVAPRDTVGAFLEVVAEGKGVNSYLFETKQKGYPGWRWSVTLFQANKKSPITISEVVLLPGDAALLAPNWVPWSERLADYRALQAELEAQNADEAEEQESEPEEVEVDVVVAAVEADSEEESLDVAEDEAVQEPDEAEALAVTKLDQAEEPEQDTVAASGKKPRIFRRRKRFGKK